MQAYIQQNSMQVLDADKLLPVFNAASIYTFKVFYFPLIVVVKQTIMQTYMQPKRIQVFDADKFLPALDAA